MAAGTPSTGIFHGTEEIVSTFLGLDRGETLKQKTTCRRLSSPPEVTPDFEALVADLYERMERNRSDHTPSQENWRSEGQTTLDPNNRSPEVLLERAIAILGGRGILDGWFNQVPVASGLVDGLADKRAAIDLVHHRDGHAAFIELKWESDTPAYAAFEILLYGLTYLFCYARRKPFGYEMKPLMTVKNVSLRVLAPRDYYGDCNLTWLGKGLDEGIRTLAATKTDDTLSMDFGFLAFPLEFELPFDTGKEVQKILEPQNAEKCRSVISALSNLDPVWRPGGSKTP